MVSPCYHVNWYWILFVHTFVHLCSLAYPCFSVLSQTPSIWVSLSWWNFVGIDHWCTDLLFVISYRAQTQCLPVKVDFSIDIISQHAGSPRSCKLFALQAIDWGSLIIFLHRHSRWEGRRHVPPKVRENIFRQLLCKIQAFFGQRSCKIREFC